MKKLIEFSQINCIECDTPNCDFVIKNDNPENPMDGSEYVNVACPKCGGNLLTQKDYEQFKVLLKLINRVNKWFGWIAYLIPSKYKTTSNVKVHNGVKINNNPTQ